MGTAAGAAKARERRAQRPAQPSNSRQSTDGALIVADATDGGLIPAVGQTGQAVSVLVPKALRLADELMDGKHKASAAVRAKVALDVLAMSAKPAQQPTAGADLAHLVGALAKALGVREPRTFDSAEVVTPATPDTA